MAVRFIPFAPEHLRHLEVQPEQQGERAATLCDPEIAGGLRNRGVALTALGDTDQAGRAVVLGCGGVLHRWHGVALAWALVGSLALPREWLAITRRVESVIHAAHRAGVWRIEAQADAGYAPACRWLELMGFEREQLLEGWSPLGRDCWLYKHMRRDLLPAKEA
jgi:hypothetical protein